MDATAPADVDNGDLGRRTAESDASDVGFVETAYLLANPDIAAAVAVGSFRSGRHHYLRRVWTSVADGSSCAGRYDRHGYVTCLTANL